jgi:hypothetical protein
MARGIPAGKVSLTTSQLSEISLSILAVLMYEELIPYTRVALQRMVDKKHHFDIERRK